MAVYTPSPLGNHHVPQYVHIVLLKEMQDLDLCILQFYVEDEVTYTPSVVQYGLAGAILL